jgi:hypothetical protein
VPFLLKILMEAHESESVRIHVLKQLRNGDGLLVPADRPGVANAISDVLADSSNTQLRLEAALALGAFSEIDGALELLGNLALAPDESIDLRMPLSHPPGPD